MALLQISGRASTPASTPASSSDVSHSDRVSINQSILSRLLIGHCCAISAVISLIHATFASSNTLTPNVIVLLICIIPLRTVLAIAAHSVSRPAITSGLLLALQAAAVFSSNALHILATRVSRRYFLPLIASAVADVAAAWLHMTVSASFPTTHRFAIPISLVYTSADIYLAAIITGNKTLILFSYPFVTVRFVINLAIIVARSNAIVQREQQKRHLSKTRT